MGILATFAIPVKLQDEGFEAQALLGPALLALAAVIAAAIAAYVSIQNRKAELEHDRKMRDRDELRQTLDDAARELVETIKELITASDWLYTAKAASEQDEFDDAISKARDSRREAFDEARLLVATTSLLRLRLENDDPIIRAHTAARNRLNTAVDQYGLAISAATFGEVELPSPEIVGDGLAMFLTVCRAHFDERELTSDELDDIDEWERKDPDSEAPDEEVRPTQPDEQAPETAPTDQAPSQG